MKRLFLKYKEQILYLFFGGATTLINILVYNLCYYLLDWSNTLSNAIAWISSVLFAYITNKIFVFESKEHTVPHLLKELSSFALCRVLTGALDILIMYISVDVLHLVAWQFKIISNVIVIICNYIASKKIFKKEKRFDEKNQNH